MGSRARSARSSNMRARSTRSLAFGIKHLPAKPSLKIMFEMLCHMSEHGLLMRGIAQNSCGLAAPARGISTRSGTPPCCIPSIEGLLRPGCQRTARCPRRSKAPSLPRSCCRRRVCFLALLMRTAVLRRELQTRTRRASARLYIFTAIYNAKSGIQIRRRWVRRAYSQPAPMSKRHSRTAP
ncbi:hypothetical protein SAMN05444158_3175 [Bradyrhizobium canariense]|uniref:Uncharacterized protein n=1 Tax=Bradyrhizobium canariense TaxID=255045 RepID=A0A1H1UZ88_9BRAD|nr:hypothetical protein SAMN05444158_3175 [Bradyrhizobium canariense]